MSVDYSVNLMYGIVVRPEEMRQIAHDIGSFDVDLNDYEEIETMMHQSFDARGLSAKGLLGFIDTGDPYSDDTVFGIVYAGSSAIWNDSKRGDGKLFEEKVIAKSDLNITDEEKKALKRFRKTYGLINRAEMLVMGTSN